MKKRSIVMFIAVIMCCLLIAGCADNSASSADTGALEMKQESEEEPEGESKKNRKKKKNTDDDTDVSKSEIPSLTKEQCEEEIEKLLKTEPVHPDNAATLKAMADCATSAGVVESPGEIFSKLDNDRRSHLRYRFLEAVMWGDSDLYEEIATVFDDAGRGVSVEEGKKLFLDAYGEGEFTPTEYEQVENGYIIPQFGDGEAVDLVMGTQYFEDDDYILLCGPMFYESNGEGEKFEGCADILFAKNPGSRFGATLLYGRLRDVDIDIASVETSSELTGSGNKSYSGKNLTDGDPSTVWVEGVPGTGVGETITLHLDKKQSVYGIQIVIGYTASYDQYIDNGMPTDIEVDFGNGVRAEGHELEGYANENYSPQDLVDMNRFRVGLDEPVVTDTVTVKITGAKKGAKYDDICISEILVYGPGNVSESSDSKGGLSKEDAAEIADNLGGMVCVLERHDYDGDGANEAFVVLGENDEYGGYLPHQIWFISSEGKTEMMRDDFKGLALYTENDNFYMEYPAENKVFFYGDCGGYGSGWTTFLFSVNDGKPYELDISMNTEGFYQDKDKPGEFYTLTDNFDNGHAYLRTELIYNSKTGQFEKGRITEENWAG